MAVQASFIANENTQALVQGPDLSLDEVPAISLKALATKIALDNGISTSTLFNLVGSESNWNPKAEGDKGCSFGLAQINICAHTEVSKKEAVDPEFALTYAAEAISKSTEDKWSVCNCFSYVQANFVKNLPRMAEIVVNTNISHKGEIAIFMYTDRVTGKPVKHIAYVSDENGTIKEANKTHCLTDSRVVDKADIHLLGYYAPNV